MCMVRQNTIGLIDSHSPSNDLEAMKLVGVKGAPADAEPEILSIADWVSTKNGGYGVIRELARILSKPKDYNFSLRSE